ncbi:SPASM domain-containing protein [Thermodesulfovibrionales bacterium]|nr:SPASM domain-containing protein [Thermodesulfovibrionales bacterium]
MCTWRTWNRKPNVINIHTYIHTLEKFKPYREYIQYLTLHGCGEPLLDKGLAEKVKIAKEMGFKGTGFATNCTELDEHKSLELIEAGLDTIICSIDGISKHTHEAIRVGTSFEKIVSNVKSFIKIRNKLGRTRVMVRFIRQEINKQEWPLFFDYWSRQVNKDFGDEVVKFDVHNWADKLDDYQSKDLNRSPGLDHYICQDVFERMWIYSNGDIGLCCADDNGFYKLGNVIDSDPIGIYNNETFNHYRKMMTEDRTLELEHCKTCTIPRSRVLKKSD